jgi:hypothetical protein
MNERVDLFYILLPADVWDYNLFDFLNFILGKNYRM